MMEGNTHLQGVSFVTNGNNERIAVQLDLSIHGALWEDIWDLIIAHSRKDEEEVGLEEFKEQLK